MGFHSDRRSSVGFALAVLASAATSQGSGSGERLLAHVPEGLEVTTQLVRRNNLSCWSSRNSIAWSADGRTVAYAAQRGEEYFPVVGDAVGEALGWVDAPLVRGGHVFFHVAGSKSKTEERHWLWVDGRKLGPEDWMGDLVVRADGKQIAYWTRPGARFGGATTPMSAKYIFVVATDKGSQWSLARGDEWNEQGTACFSADGKRLFAAAEDRKGWSVLEDGKKSKQCEPCPGIESFACSADGSTLALVRIGPRRTEGRADGSAFLSEADAPELLLRGKRVGRERAVVSTATVDAIGSHVACVVTREGKRTVAIDEERAPPGVHDFVLELAFDPAGRSLAFVAVDGGAESKEYPGMVDGGSWLVGVRALDGGTALDGGAVPVEPPRFLEARDLVWDAKGERLAYAAREESGWRIVCGETRSATHADVGPPVFSADGRTVAFGSWDGRELWWRELALP
jgi:hypothetical protein